MGQLASAPRRILITGASGMLGASLVAAWSNKYEIYATGGSDFVANPARHYRCFDLCSSNYAPLIDWARPDAIVHCAALTNLERCESEPALADAINAQSVARLLAVAPSARILFISTDAVFPDGNRLASEDTPTAPQNAYGRSKARGEQLLAAAPGHCAIRTTIVGRNLNAQKTSFAEWIVGSVQARRPIQLFTDAWFTPISIWHFADELEWIMTHATPPVLHVTGAEVVSKYELGVALCRALRLDLSSIGRGSIAAASFKARRSADQTLGCTRYRTLSGRQLPSLQDTIGALAEAFAHATPTGANANG